MAAFVLTMAELSTYNRGLWSAKPHVTILEPLQKELWTLPCPSGRVEGTKAGRLLHQLPPNVPVSPSALSTWLSTLHQE